MRMLHCVDCGDFIEDGRSRLGYKVCKDCGEVRAMLDRSSWCVAQEYGKGNYQLITKDSAKETLRQTNQKHLR